MSKNYGTFGKFTECHFQLEPRIHPPIYLRRGSGVEDLVCGKTDRKKQQQNTLGVLRIAVT